MSMRGEPTGNLREFQPVPTLRVENWLQQGPG